MHCVCSHSRRGLNVLEIIWQVRPSSSRRPAKQVVMMFPMQSMPQLSCFSTQMLTSLMESLEMFTCQGMLEAAADVVRLLVQCSLPDPALSTPLPSCHACPLNFPPPLLTPRKRRRRQRRRRSKSTESRSSSSLSTDVDAIVTSILELPVTSAIQAEADMEELAWDDDDVRF